MAAKHLLVRLRDRHDAGVRDRLALKALIDAEPAYLTHSNLAEDLWTVRTIAG
jgi:hypothetical protein